MALLSDLCIRPEDAIIDIGCGKGSAMRTMLKFPFSRIDGVELSGRIAAIAQVNFRRVSANRVMIYIDDASQFSDYDAYNIVYLYNPFPDSIMVKVVAAFIDSVHRAERELLIIYNNPICHDLIADQGVFSVCRVHSDEWGNDIRIYSNHGDFGRLFGATKPGFARIRELS